MWSISNPRVAAVSAPPLVSKSPSHHLRANTFRLDVFSRGRHGRPPLLSSPCLRTRRMIPYCSEISFQTAERSSIAENPALRNKEREARIKKELLEPELSPSPYDTAWVAMVPLPGFSQAPCFPQCVEWILQNQNDNGSWSTSEFDLSTSKCTLLSTLACVVALKKWNVGPEHITRGLHYIGTNFSIAMDQQITAPIGYNITFTGLISLAIGMGLEFPVRKTDVDTILQIRQMELNRYGGGDKSYGREAYMAYVAEGLGNLPDWNEVMKFQRKNGSLFNSPSTTAAALIYFYDEKALQYLNFIVSKFGNAGPTVLPINIYCQLSMVDSLEKIGISRHFSSEIISILDTTYSLWLQRDDEIMLDIATCAMAFRLLRMNGYNVSSDELSHVAEASTFCNSLEGYLDDTKSLLELYKASIVSVSKDELILKNIESWSGNLLTKQLCSNVMHKMPIFGEVEYALKFPFYATMERLDHRRNIEHFDVIGHQMLKKTYSPCHVNKDHLAFAIEEFTFSQCIYQDELMDLESWVKENMLDQLQFARQKQAYCHLSASATIFPPELSDARLSWAKNSVLTSILDDFFDIAGSKEELENLVALVEKWDEHHDLQFYSERVKILFCAIYATNNQLGVMASAVQKRDVRNHLINLWIYVVRSMMTEAEWSRTQYVPNFDEYMTAASISYVLGPIVLPTLYFLGEELSESMVEGQEYNELFRLMSTCGRLLNDIQTIEKEGIENTVNSISLLVLSSGGSMSAEAAKKEIQESIDSCRRELLRLVLKKDTVVPAACKQLFWKMNQVNHLFYSHTDGYTSQTEMVGAVNAVIFEPLRLQIRDPTFVVKPEQ